MYLCLWLSVSIGHAGKFDVLLAADVIYEDDQVLPLITTASRILKRTSVD